MRYVKRGGAAVTEFYRGKRVLITGGIGFIGSNLAIRLVELGARVQLVDSMLPAYGADLANIEPIRDKVRVNFSDVRDRHSLGYIVQDEDLIFSLAGQVSHIESMQDPMTDLEINCRSQLSLLECCRQEQSRRQDRLRQHAADCTAGREYASRWTSPIRCNPVDVNGINKLAAEMYYTLYHQVHGIPTVSLRLTNTYGPRMDLRSDEQGFRGRLHPQRAGRRNDPHLRRRASSGGTSTTSTTCWTRCCSPASNDAIHGDVFNLGHPRPYSLLSSSRSCTAWRSSTHELVPFPGGRRGDRYRRLLRRLPAVSRATGWKPAVDLPKRAARTLAWFRRPLVTAPMIAYFDYRPEYRRLRRRDRRRDGRGCSIPAG